METTDFEDVLRETAEEVTLLDPANIPTESFKAIRRSCTRRLQDAWEYHFWPFLDRTEQRYFRADWNTTDTYLRGDQRFYPPTQKYYQALTTVPANNAPADSNGDLDPNYWAECETDPAAQEWDFAVDYNQEDQVYYGGDVYVMFDTGPQGGIVPTELTVWSKLIPFDKYVAYEGEAGSTSQGSSPVTVRGTLALGNGVQAGTVTGLGLASALTLVNCWVMRPTGGLNIKAWPLTDTFSTGGFGFELDALTDGTGYVLAYEGYAAGVADVVTTGTGTPIGIVAGAFSRNPRISTRGNELNWFLSENGVQIKSAVVSCWLDFRIRCPKLTGNVFDATAIYAADDQIYFSSAATPGNFYIASLTTSAGQSPDTTPAKWDIVEIPRPFHRYLVHAVASDWVRGPGGGTAEDSQLQRGLAMEALEYQKSLLVGQQSQRVKTVVTTR